MNQADTLNLYTNYRNASKQFFDTRIIFDEVLNGFPELGYETTYKESHDIILKRAYQLSSKGIKPNDKVMIYKSPRFDTYLLAVAVSYLGAVPVMVSYHLNIETIDVFANRLEDCYLLYDTQTADKVRNIKNIPHSHLLDVRDVVLAEPNEVSQYELKPNEISYMTHTSGTTGIPKLICHSAQSMGWRIKWQQTVLNRMKETGLVAFHISPVHSRFNIGVASLMSLGFPIIPFSNGGAPHFISLIKHYRPMALETHPNHFVQWSRWIQNDVECLSSIQYYHSTFDAINNDTMRTFLKASNRHDAIFLQVYGQSECGPMILKAHTLDSLKVSDARNMGTGLKGLTEARITNENGEVVSPGESGHIQFLSKGRALTYYKENQRFNENVYDDWWDSGDWGMIDSEGCLHLKDRQVDLIDTVDSTLKLEDYLLDRLEFLSEVVIVRGKNGTPQPIIAISEFSQMNWNRWWNAVSDLPSLNEPIIKKFDEIPRTATMKVQRLQIEKELNEMG